MPSGRKSSRALWFSSHLMFILYFFSFSVLFEKKLSSVQNSVYIPDSHSERVLPCSLYFCSTCCRFGKNSFCSFPTGSTRSRRYAAGGSSCQRQLGLSWGLHVHSARELPPRAQSLHSWCLSRCRHREGRMAREKKGRGGN